MKGSPRLAVCLAPLLLGIVPLSGQAPWHPAPPNVQLPIWPGTPPNSRVLDSAEAARTVTDSTGRPHLVGGKPWIYLSNVSTPTMTVYPAQGTNSGAAVVVFPGGGYEILAIDLEGSEACDWLTARGITCILLKYRVPCMKQGPYRECPTALQDAIRAIRLVRHSATRWHIDPHKIGVLGFSAGGHLVVATSTQYDRRLYAPVDSADRESGRPDFGVALYPGHIAIEERQFVLNPDIKVTSHTPPTILIQAQNDPVDPVENSLVYYGALRKAHVPAELHIFATGGHAFGLRPTNAPITHWPALVEQWLATIGMISK